MKEYRLEKDSIGSKEVPIDRYYGVQSLRGKENFSITGRRMNEELIHSIVVIKKAACLVNMDCGCLDKKIGDAIVLACDEVLSGKLLDEFIVDAIQGGAGTSMNMNANEVIANRAIEILGGKKGDYSIVHPNDHVNFAQSTNDVIPSAGKMTAYVLCLKLEKALQKLFLALLDKMDEFIDVYKMGRTQMQDAVPITLGQEFFAYADSVMRGLCRINKTKDEMLGLNMGGTAIGTGINTDIRYFKEIVPKIAELSSISFYQVDNLIDSTSNIDCFASLSSSIKSCAISVSKIANDLRLMSSGPRTGFSEIILPSMQNGSSIMPGKVNPVIPEVVNQAFFKICGNDITISMACEAGQLELNAFEPVIFDCLFESIHILTNAINTFTENCVVGIKANRERCFENVTNSVGIATALCPHIGYQKSSEIAKKAIEKNKNLKDILLEEKLFSEKEIDNILDFKSMIGPGIKKK